MASYTLPDISKMPRYCLLCGLLAADCQCGSDSNRRIKMNINENDLNAALDRATRNAVITNEPSTWQVGFSNAQVTATPDGKVTFEAMVSLEG